MSRGSSAVSLEELYGHQSEALDWSLTLPTYAPTDRLDIDIELLGRIARLGGVSHTRVGGYNGGQTQYYADVDRVDKEGLATASTSFVVSRAEPVRTEVETRAADKKTDFSEYWWANASIDVNTDELDKQVWDEARNGEQVREPYVWSKYLDKDLRLGLSRIATRQLIGNVSRPSQLLTGINLAWPSLMAAVSSPDYSAKSVLFNAVFASGVIHGIRNTGVKQVDGINSKERRRSLVPGYQLDRLLVAQCLLRSRKIVTSRDIKK